MIFHFRWLAQFKMHLEDTIDKLKKGKHVTGRLTPRAPAARKTKDRNLGKSILKRPGIVSTLYNNTYTGEGSFHMWSHCTFIHSQSQ